VPGLSIEALRSQIHARQLAPVYLLFGDDVTQMERLVDAIEATVDEADRPFAVERVYAGEEGGSPLDAAAAANVFPMLGDRRIVIVLRAERFLKPRRAGKAGDGGDAGDADSPDEESEAGAIDTAPLEAYLEKPSPSSVLVFVAAAIDRSRRLTKRLIEKAAVVECSGIVKADGRGRREVQGDKLAEIRREIAAAGRTMEARAFDLLVERSGGEVSKLRGDVERLVLFTEGQTSISRGDVEEIVTVATLVDDWGVVNAIGDGDAGRALREVGLRFDRGDSPHQLVGQLRWWVSARLAPAAPDRAVAAIDALLRTDLALKSSGGDPRVLVERLVVELTGRPVASWGGARR